MILSTNSHRSQLEASERSSLCFIVLLKLCTVSRYTVLIIITFEVIATCEDQLGLASTYLRHYRALPAHSNNIPVGDAPVPNQISSVSYLIVVRGVCRVEEVDFRD